MATTLYTIFGEYSIVFIQYFDILAILGTTIIPLVKYTIYTIECQ